VRGFSALLYIWKIHIRKHMSMFVFAVLFLGIASLFYALEIYMIRFIFDDLLSPQSSSGKSMAFHDILKKIGGDSLGQIGREQLFTIIPLTLVAIFLLKGVFNYFGKYWLDGVGLATITDLRDLLYEKLLKQGQDFFSEFPTGTLISRLLNDIERMKTAVSEKLTEISTALFSLTALLVSAFVQDWKMTMVSLVTIPLVVYPLARFSRKLRKVSKRSQEEIARLADQMKETLTGVKIVQMFLMEEKEVDRFKTANNHLFKVNLKATRVMALTTPLMEFIGAFAVAGILYYGHFKIMSGQITLGSFSAFLATLYAMYVPVKKLSQANNIVQQAVAAADRSVELLEWETQVTEKQDASDLPPFSKEIFFDNVSFFYGRKTKVLDGISLTIPKGVCIALVGPSGAGKSTLVSLIPRLFDVTGGRLCIDGRDLRDITLKSLRKQIGMVTQDTVLFDLTAAENIAYGNTGIAREKIIEAAERAKAYDFIASLPQGFDTRLGEGGFSLSGGQRQRMAIARAILQDPPILILDEATSSLDSESESGVQEAIKELMQGRTTIIIAHRLSTVINADLTVVLENGKIVEMGRHSELVKNSGRYARLCELEFRAAIPDNFLKGD
jgi:ATP-binding cassette, subfamily B, bacterial MsbA